MSHNTDDKIILMSVALVLQIYGGRFAITANGRGLALFWNLKNVRPEPMLIKDKKVKVNNQSQIEKRPARTEAQ